MAWFSVIIPIAGHAYMDVEADSEEAAIEMAMADTTIDHIETWWPIETFNEGNVCYCPRPWSAEAERHDEPEDEE